MMLGTDFGKSSNIDADSTALIVVRYMSQLGPRQLALSLKWLQSLLSTNI